MGSGHVASAPGVNVSSATVRNEMAVLEQEGYLAPAPHERRAGAHRQGLPLLRRHPRPARPRSTPADAQQVRSFFAQAHGELEQMLADTSRLLSSLTHYAAVVVGPPHEAATMRSVQLVGLTPRVALLVVVLCCSFALVARSATELRS